MQHAAALASAVAVLAGHAAFAFQVRPELSNSNARGKSQCAIRGPPFVRPRGGASPTLAMVRNVDLPEVLVFYGTESVLTPRVADDGAGDATRALRSGVARLLNECREVGTSALVLSEELGAEEGVKAMFREAWERLPGDIGGGKIPLETLTNGDDPVLHFRCLDSEFTTPAREECPADAAEDHDVSEECDDSLAFYHLHAGGRSPSPAFLLDALCSVHMDPRGFGGSSGFGRGQWIEPRRSPMPARAVVFVAGDRPAAAGGAGSAARDRCVAARAAGCRTVWLEDPETPQSAPPRGDEGAMDLCDAVVSSLGNDNPRDLQPVTLDAVATPGDYWLNPPLPRDDVGNRVAVDEIVEFFRSERAMEERAGGEDCVAGEDSVEEEMSDDEMNKILADLDGL